MTQSIEPNIVDLVNDWLKLYKLDYRLEQESFNVEIDKALDDYFSKNNGADGNRPDAKMNVSTMPTVPSTAALSFGALGRAGMIAVP